MQDKYTVGTYLNDQWHHAVLVRTSTRLKGYVDAVLAVDFDASTIGNIDVSGNLNFGRWSSLYFKGYIDEARIYNAALTASAVHDRYLSGLDNLLASSQITEQEYQEKLSDLNLNYATNE